jgi:TDG/mug DNA glycosylase family protein
MNLKKGFPPIARKDALVLILGSMPGEESLRKNEYYANPRNSFWKIMCMLFGFDPGISYKKRTDILKRNNIALWDVMKECERPGSLDTDIQSETIIENDFVSFFQKFPGIRNVLFNGYRAEKEYRKRVLPKLSSMEYEIKRNLLPSTSPAMTQLSFNDKILKWSMIKTMV